MAGRNCSALAEMNPLSIDKFVCFSEEKHEYGERMSSNAPFQKVHQSTTALKKSCFGGFAGSAIVNQNYDKWKRGSNPKYYDLIHECM